MLFALYIRNLNHLFHFEKRKYAFITNDFLVISLPFSAYKLNQKVFAFINIKLKYKKKK